MNSLFSCVLVAFPILLEKAFFSSSKGQECETWSHNIKYARIEHERRFLLERFPTVHVVRIRCITDCYIEGTTLRLREQSEVGGPTIFKLTRKVPARATGAQEGLITSMYLTKDALTLPSFIGVEVSGDNRFTGGRLVSASRQDIQAWLLEYGIRLGSS
jgi:hypothetical protein